MWRHVHEMNLCDDGVVPFLLGLPSQDQSIHFNQSCLYLGKQTFLEGLDKIKQILVGTRTPSFFIASQEGRPFVSEIPRWCSPALHSLRCPKMRERNCDILESLLTSFLVGMSHGSRKIEVVGGVGLGLGFTHSCSGLWLNPHFSFRFSLPPSVNKQYFCWVAPLQVVSLFISLFCSPETTAYYLRLVRPSWGISGTPLDEAIAFLSPFLQPE